MSITLNVLARVFPQVRQMHRDTIRIKSEREEWRQRYNSLEARTGLKDSGSISVPNSDFLADERFRRAYAAGRGSTGEKRSEEWRVYVGLWAAEQAQRVPGDYVACGARRGLMGRAIVEYLDWEALNKTFYLVSAPESEMSAMPVRAGLSEKFAGFSNVRVITGELPGSLAQISTPEIACLYVGLHSPAAAAAGEALWPRVTAGGGVVVLEDFREPANAPQRQAWEAFAQEQELPILALPTGQGLMVKP